MPRLNRKSVTEQEESAAQWELQAVKSRAAAKRQKVVDAVGKHEQCLGAVHDFILTWLKAKEGTITAVKRPKKILPGDWLEQYTK